MQSVHRIDSVSICTHFPLYVIFNFRAGGFSTSCSQRSVAPKTYPAGIDAKYSIQKRHIPSESTSHNNTQENVGVKSQIMSFYGIHVRRQRHDHTTRQRDVGDGGRSLITICITRDLFDGVVCCGANDDDDDSHRQCVVLLLRPQLNRERDFAHICIIVSHGRHRSHGSRKEPCDPVHTRYQCQHTQLDIIICLCICLCMFMYTLVYTRSRDDDFVG